jgi:predicted RNA-binding protein with PUA-like domain
MAHWLLQCNPAHWRIRDFFGHRRTSIAWTVRRHRDRMAPGDDVAIWLSGKAGGVVAVGRVTGKPYYGTAAPADEKYWTSDHERQKERWHVPVEFTRDFLDAPITRETLRADERFAGSLILRMPGGPNPFPVAPAEWPAIADRVPPRPGGSPWRNETGHPQMVATTVRTAAAVVAAGATAVREALRAVVSR